MRKRAADSQHAFLCLFGFFALAEYPDHFSGEAEAVILDGEGVAFIPARVGELGLVDGDLIIGRKLIDNW